MVRSPLISLAAVTLALLTPGSALAQKTPGCEALPDHAQLKAALQPVVREGMNGNGGLGNQSWAVVVNRDGVVCAVVFSGPDRSAQWPGSRLIAAQKAHTANALSLPNFALSTGNLWYAAQPGQSLYGLIAAAPPNPTAAYAGPPEKFGQPDDPLVGQPIGGIVVFGGGLALYDGKGKIVGALGVSGDTSCADHVVAWKVRHALKLSAVPGGVAPNRSDNLLLDLDAKGVSVSGYGHPSCTGGKPSDEIIKTLHTRLPVGPRP